MTSFFRKLTTPPTTPSPSVADLLTTEIKAEDAFEDASDVPSTSSGRSNKIEQTYMGTILRSAFPEAKQTLDTADSSLRTLTAISALIGDSVQDTACQIQAATSTFSSMASTISSTTQSLNDLLISIKAIVEGHNVLSRYARRIMDAVAILIDIIVLWFSKKTMSLMLPTISTLLYRLFALFEVPEALIRHALIKLCARLSPKEANQEKVTMQPEGDGPPHGLSSLFVEIVGTFLMKRMPNDKDIQAVNNRLRFCELFRKEYSSIQDTLLACIRSLPVIVKEWIARMIPINWWLALFNPEGKYYRWLNELEMLNTRSMEERLTYDEDVQSMVRRLHKEGLELIEECTRHGPEYNKVFSLLRDRMKKLDDMYAEVDVSGHTRTDRPVPFVIYLYGLPGQGKSFLSGIIPKVLAKVDNEARNINWSRNPTIQHWDGYTGQFGLIYDDFGATRDTNIAPGEYAELMSIVSNQQYRLPMASLEKKGEVFRSKVVVLSSNNGWPAPNSINDFVALWRRRHAMYEVEVHERFRKNGSVELDPSLLVRGDYSHYKIRRILHPTSPTSEKTEWMTYGQFIIDVEDRYHRHLAEQQNAMEAAREMVEEALQQHRAMQPQGKLLDAMHKFEAVCGMQTPAEAFIYQLKQFWTDNVPDWLTAALIGSSLIAGLIGFIGFAVKKMQEPDEVKQQRDQIQLLTETIAKLTSELKAEGIMQPEGDPQSRRIIENAMSVWKGVLDDDKIQEIIDRYCPEGAYHGVKHMPKQPHITRMSPESDRFKRIHNNREYRQRIAIHKNMATEGTSDANSLAIVKNRVFDNLVSVAREGMSMHGLFLVGRVLLIPKHFFYTTRGEPLQGGEVITIVSYDVVYMDRYKCENMIPINGDCVLYLCGPNVANYNDIRKHFIVDNDLQMKGEVSALLCSFSDGIPYIQQIVAKRNTKAIDVPFDWTGTKDVYESGNIIQVHQGWQYLAQTTNGSCGSPLAVMDTAFARKLLGIHVATTPGQPDGAAMLVTQEMINEGMAKLPKPIVNSGLLPNGVTQEVVNDMVMTPQGNFSTLGRLYKPIFAADKTKIRPSDIHGKIFPPSKGPAVLSSKDPRCLNPRDPLRKGVEKYGNIAPVFDMDKLHQVGDHIVNIFRKWTIIMPKEVVTIDVAINGSPCSEHALPLVMDTSPGYPYNQRPKISGMKGKASLFAGEPGLYYIADPELEMSVHNRIRLAQQNMRAKSLWIDCKKDELRSLKKIEEGSTRVFTIPPVDFTLVFRMYTLSFTTNFVANHHNMFSAVGMNPESFDWTKMISQLQENSEMGFAGDYSGWDGNISPHMIMECARVINAWYNDGEENANVRIVLFDEIAHTPQAFRNVVYMTHIGNPSGNPATAPMNTIIGGMYIRYCWLNVAPPKYLSLSHFEENVKDKIFGDDNMLSVKPDVRSFFNPDSLSDELAKLNMVYTSASKDGRAEWKKITELTFLKRGIRKGERGLWLPLMSKETIQELTNWVRESDFKTNREMTLDNCNEALRFAFFYGPAYFDDLRQKIMHQMPKDASLIHSYEFYHQWFYDGHCETSQAVRPVDFRGAQVKTTLRTAYETYSMTKALDTTLSLDREDDGSSPRSRYNLNRIPTAIDANMETPKQTKTGFLQPSNGERLSMVPQGLRILLPPPGFDGVDYQQRRWNRQINEWESDHLIMFPEGDTEPPKQEKPSTSKKSIAKMTSDELLERMTTTAHSRQLKQHMRDMTAIKKSTEKKLKVIADPPKTGRHRIYHQQIVEYCKRWNAGCEHVGENSCDFGFSRVNDDEYSEDDQCDYCYGAQLFFDEKSYVDDGGDMSHPAALNRYINKNIAKWAHSPAWKYHTCQEKVNFLYDLLDEPLKYGPVWDQSLMVHHASEQWKQYVDNGCQEVDEPECCHHTEEEYRKVNPITTDPKFTLDVRYPPLGEKHVRMTPEGDVRNMANAKGIVSMFQRDAAQDDGSDQPIAEKTRLAAECVSDPEWQLPEMAKRRVWVDTYTWTTSNNFQANIFKLNSPWDLLKNYMQQAPFERFLFFNGNMKVRVHVTATRFHAGRLIIAFIPGTVGAQTVNWQEADMASLMGCPNVFIDATASNEGVLEIPFYNLKSFLYLNGPYNSDSDFTGTLIAQVFSPLVAATGVSASVNVNLWVEFEPNSQFRVPLHTAATGLRAFNLEHAKQIQARATKALGEYRLQMRPEGNTGSATTNINNYGKVENMTVPSEITGDSIGNGNSASGLPMDKPGYMANPIPMRLKAMQNIASTIGTELVTRLDLDPSQQNLSISEMFSTETDEMEMKWLLTRPTFAGRVAWTTSIASGASLLSRFMGPMCSLFTDGAQTQIALTDGAAVPMTQWEYICKHFRFWRGSIKLRIDIIATQFHTGDLFLAWNYGAPPDAETGMRDATSQYGVEIHLSNEKHTWEFEIPYNAPTPWLQVCRGPINSAQEIAASWFSRYFLGSFNLRVVNQLTVSDNVPAGVDVVWSISGGDDFAVYYPAATNSCFPPYHVPDAVEEDDEYEHLVMSPQGDAGSGMSGEDAVGVPTTTEGQSDSGITIAPPGASITFPHSHFGNKAAVSHLGSLLKRYVPYATLDFAEAGRNGTGYVQNGILGQAGILDTPVGFTMAVYPNQPMTPAPDRTPPAHYLGFCVVPVQPLASLTADPKVYFGQMYRFWRGSMRYKMFWQNLSFAGSNLPIPVSSYGAVFLPGVRNTYTGNPNWAAIALTYANCTDWQAPITTDAVVADITRLSMYSNSPLAADIALTVAPYTDIEIPFTTIFNTLYTNNAVPSSLPPEMLSPGNVLFYFRFTGPGDETAVGLTQFAGINWIPNVLTSFGDDARFGTFLGKPRVKAIQIYNEGTAKQATGAFDTWIVSNPAERTSRPSVRFAPIKQKEEEEDQMTKSMIAEALQAVKDKRVQMRPQGDETFPMSHTRMLFNNYKGRAFPTERSRLNELKNIMLMSLDTEQQASGMGHDMDWTVTLQTSSKYAFLDDHQGCGVGKTKAQAMEIAAKQVCDEVEKAFLTEYDLYWTKRELERQKEFEKAYGHTSKVLKTRDDPKPEAMNEPPTSGDVAQAELQIGSVSLAELGPAKGDVGGAASELPKSTSEYQRQNNFPRVDITLTDVMRWKAELRMCPSFMKAYRDLVEPIRTMLMQHVEFSVTIAERGKTGFTEMRIFLTIPFGDEDVPFFRRVVLVSDKIQLSTYDVAAEQAMHEIFSEIEDFLLSYNLVIVPSDKQ